MLSFSRPESSMPDLLKDIREQLDARLAELRPLVDEHGRLNSGVDPNTLSALLAWLVNAGELQTRALPTGRTGYALADGAPAQPAGA